MDAPPFISRQSRRGRRRQRFTAGLCVSLNVNTSEVGMPDNCNCNQVKKQIRESKMERAKAKPTNIQTEAPQEASNIHTRPSVSLCLRIRIQLSVTSPAPCLPFCYHTPFMMMMDSPYVTVRKAQLNALFYKSYAGLAVSSQQ